MHYYNNFVCLLSHSSTLLSRAFVASPASVHFKESDAGFIISAVAGTNFFLPGFLSFLVRACISSQF